MFDQCLIPSHHAPVLNQQQMYQNINSKRKLNYVNEKEGRQRNLKFNVMTAIL